MLKWIFARTGGRGTGDGPVSWTGAGRPETGTEGRFGSAPMLRVANATATLLGTASDTVPRDRSLGVAVALVSASLTSLQSLTASQSRL